MAIMNAGDNNQWIAANSVLGNNTGSPALATNLNAAAVAALISFATPIPTELGGTGTSNTASNGGFWSVAGGVITRQTNVASANRFLRMGASTPTWTASAYPVTAPAAGVLVRASSATTFAATSMTLPDTVAVNSLLYASASNVISALAPVNSAIFQTTSGSVPAWNTNTLTDGQVYVGTATSMTGATISSSSGVNVASSSGAIALNLVTGGNAVVEVTGTSQTLAPNTVYIANNASLVTFTLPASGVSGVIYQVIGLGAGGWRIAQNASQVIKAAATTTTTGVGGSVSSTNQYDCMTIVGTGSGNLFITQSFNGTLTFV